MKGLVDFGLRFIGSKDFVLFGYSDADWAGDLVSRKSTSGYLFRIGGATVSWKSKRQSIVALSSTEAEYVALCSAAQEAVWLRNLLTDINQAQHNATTIHEDNQGAISLARNPNNHPATKHIEVKFHYMREKITSKQVDLLYWPTNEMVTDIFTKGLARPAYEALQTSMGVNQIS